MKFLTKAKLLLAKSAKIDLNSIQTDTVQLFYFEEGEIQEGYEVFVTDEEGTYILPEDGEYEYNGKTIVVVSGIVSEIRENGTEEDLKEKNALETEVPTQEDIEEIKDFLEVVAEQVGGEALEKFREEFELNMTKISDRITAIEQKLSVVKNTSNGKFEEPTPGNNKATSAFNAKDELSKFGL